jgi:adenylate kinase
MILMMGLAGSGKGTQGELLAKNLGYEYLSTGEFLRQYIKGKRREEMLAGKLVDDQEIIEIINKFLNSIATPNQSVLDGFPRSLVQAEWLLDQHKQSKLNIESVVYLKVDEGVLIQRLTSRARADDHEEAIKVRFDQYKQSTLPILDLYKNHGIKILEIQGQGEVEQIQQDILDQVKA